MQGWIQEIDNRIKISNRDMLEDYKLFCADPRAWYQKDKIKINEKKD